MLVPYIRWNTLTQPLNGHVHPYPPTYQVTSCRGSKSPRHGNPQGRTGGENEFV